MGCNVATNKFSEKVKKSGGHKESVGLSDLLEDSGTNSLLAKAKGDSRFIVLPANSFEPDPLQPRRTFNQAAIDELRMSIESHGQLQPILVGQRQANGLYPIIAGERRWRAISQSEMVLEVVAVIRVGVADELETLLMQIAENRRREQVPAFEDAAAMKRVVDYCKSQGFDQAYAANVLQISTAQLSKSLSLLKAPPVVVALSVENETQDVEVLYTLAKAAEQDPKRVEEFIDNWRNGEQAGTLRKASQELMEDLKDGKDKKEKPKAGKESAPKDSAGEVRVAESLRLDGSVLVIQAGNKTQSFQLSDEMMIFLKESVVRWG